MSVFGLHRPRKVDWITPAGLTNKFRRQLFHLPLMQTTQLFSRPIYSCLSYVQDGCALPVDPVPVEAQAERAELSDGRLLRLLSMNIPLRFISFHISRHHKSQGMALSLSTLNILMVWKSLLPGQSIPPRN